MTNNHFSNNTSHRVLMRGFTLIELLVVISIIGMLSSVVMVSLQGARDKGKIAASITFARHSYSKLYNDAVLSVDFNEASGIAPKDYTGNYTTTQTTLVRSIDTPIPDQGKSYDKSSIITSPAMVFSKPSATVLSNPFRTVSVWFKKTGNMSGSRGYIAMALDYHLYLESTDSTLRCFLNPATAIANISQIDDQKWHHILCTNVGLTPITMYIDGKLVATSATNAASNVGPYTSIYVGVDGSNANPFPGLIDNIQVFYQYLTSYDVRELYAAGLPTHTLAEAR